MDFYFLFFLFFVGILFVEKTFFYDYIKMSAINLDTTWVDEYSGDPQTSQIFGKTKTLEEGVKHILKLSGSTQTKLIRMLENVKTKFGKSVIIYLSKSILSILQSFKDFPRLSGRITLIKFSFFKYSLKHSVSYALIFILGFVKFLEIYSS